MAKRNGDAGSIPAWDGPDYPHIVPGRYSGVAVRYQGPEWLFSYRRWSLMIEFELLGESEQVRVCAFFNLGNDRNQTSAKRHSRYFRAWSMANGELPRKGQEMLPEIFSEGQVFLLEVEDCENDSQWRQKSDSETYSRVKEIVSIISNPESGIRKQESPNQAINQSSRHRRAAKRSADTGVRGGSARN